MKLSFDHRPFLWALPCSLTFGAALAFVEKINPLAGWLGFSALLLLACLALSYATRWAMDADPSDARAKTLAWMVALAFALRLLGGAATYLLLPLDGYDDEDDRSGFVYTDARRRDAQAWELAASDKNLLGAFDRSYAYDQYGGLLAISAGAYRYFSPDAHRPLMPVALSAFIAALGLPFLWKAVKQKWGTNLAIVAGWIYALYPESVLLGGSAMREPYLMAFSAFTLWGFIAITDAPREDVAHRRGIFWLAAGVAGMLAVSPIIALATLAILGGWIYFDRAGKSIPLWSIASAILIFILGLFVLSSALNRSGEFDSSSPLHIVGGWLKLAVQWDVYQLERGSGWVQKLFDEMPEWLRLPFVVVYGLFQPVLPAALVEPTTTTWRALAILRALGWYALLPVLVYAPIAAWRQKERVWLWLATVAWFWTLFASLRGGGDLWDNPRYRMLLFLWEALLVGRVILWQRETRDPWLGRIIVMEAVFVVFFGQWYASRYYHLLGQLPFAVMVITILALWALIFFGGLWRDHTRRV